MFNFSALGAMNPMGMDVDDEIPGGDDFQDITELFAQASAAMNPEEMIMMDGFSLHDAMSALEIGEPRLDTGMTVGTRDKRPFNPLAPLLPEELCWIIDRSISYEMEWHTSNQLAHSVFTLLYVHHLQEIDPDMLPYVHLLVRDPERPIELVTVVLRAHVSGLLKCCDLAWRELSKGGVNETEDWQADKCEVSLLEGWPVKAAMARLTDAIDWLTRTTKVPPQWRDALKLRLRFRLMLLRLMEHNVHSDVARFRQVLFEAQRLLSIMKNSSISEPSDNSPANAAFDPYIARRLNTFMPIRVIELPTMEETWAKLENWLNGWEELTRLAQIGDVSSWDVVGNLRNTLSTPLRPAYVRSSTQSAFFDGILVLDQYPTSWLVSRFFYETHGVHYNRITMLFGRLANEKITDIERSIVKTIVPHIRGQWFNPPRRRRHLAKEILEWHIVYDKLSLAVADLDYSALSPQDQSLVLATSLTPLYYRLSCMREVLLSGFLLELYNAYEKDFAYWYTAKILEEQLDLLDEFVSVQNMLGLQETEAHQELQFQRIFLTAIQKMCEAMFSLLVKSNISRPQPWSQTRQNLMRRYKWAYLDRYEDYETAAVATPPDLRQYLIEMSQVVEDEWSSSSDAFSMAQSILADLIEAESSKSDSTGSACVGGWAADWKDERLKVLQILVETCESLRGVKGKSSNPKLAWDPSKSLWFPLINNDQKE
ncbi:N-alpha-acetyltransferase, non-catalitic subunit [Stygiomarasmius scandens]|uniref:N-alpha-acetyltransferase, non-catalitic subunit n=1 Tax=Marasmiellus scandens TaxID=2682957 RepID=A0ABR1IQC8_9AGAR